MSDTSGGPGWWQASDGKWYPPHLQPGPAATPASNAFGAFSASGASGAPTATTTIAPTGPWAAPGNPVPAGAMPAGPAPRGSKLSGGAIAGIVAVSLLGLVIVLIAAATLLGRSTASDSSANPCTGKGCAGALGATTAPTVPAAQPGYSVYHGVGFAILLPSNAVTTGLGPAELDSFANSDIAKASPDVQAEINQLRSLPPTAGKFFAASPSGVTAGLFQTDVEVPLDTAAVDKSIGDPLRAAGASNVTVQQVSLENGDAIELTYDNTVTLASGATGIIHGAQFYEPVDGHTWLLNISEPAPVADASAIDTIADSFVVLN